MDVYFIDDSTVTFPYLFIDNITGYSKYVFEPTVIVTIKAGRERMRLPFLNYQQR